jgi:hypothetical protein
MGLLALAGFAALGLAGCMPFRFYPLPVSATEAHATFAPIATTASNLGYRFYQHADRVIVEPDPQTRIDYMFDVSGNYSMCVMIKDKNPSGGLDAAFAAGKAKGDDVWNRAMALRAATMPAPVYVVPPPPPAQPAVQINVSH